MNDGLRVRYVVLERLSKRGKGVEALRPTHHPEGHSSKKPFTQQRLQLLIRDQSADSVETIEGREPNERIARGETLSEGHRRHVPLDPDALAKLREIPMLIVRLRDAHKLTWRAISDHLEQSAATRESRPIRALSDPDRTHKPKWVSRHYKLEKEFSEEDRGARVVAETRL